jgi:hypothetical protein
MSWSAILKESETLAEQLHELLSAPLFEDTERLSTSDLACSMSLEHWAGVRKLLASRLLPSAVVLHRSQFEALVRSVWLLYAASDLEVAKLATELTPESELAAKNLAQVAKMMEALSIKAPREAYDALNRFKDNSWAALNSYVHAGVHAIKRHESGYPVALAEAVLCNANGLAIVAGMQSAVLIGRQQLVRQILELGTSHPNCMPPRL